jgi:hypothetical protein
MKTRNQFFSTHEPRVNLRCTLKITAGLAAAVASSLLTHTANAVVDFTMELSGVMHTISATDVNGNDDTANFQSILPFEENDSFSVIVKWSEDVAESDETFARNFSLTEPMQVFIDGELFATTATSRVSLSDNGAFIVRGDLDNTTYAEGWNVNKDNFSGSSYRLYLDVANANALDGTNMPTPENFDLANFSNPNFLFELREDPFGRSDNEWTTPLGSHVGGQTLRGRFESGTVTAVPEPSTYALILGVGAMLMCMARRRSA